MRKVFIFLMLIVYPSLLMATADGPDYFSVHGVSVSDVLNIRSKPTWKSSKIGSLEPLHDCVKNIHCMRVNNQNWCKISTRVGVTGWVNAKYLKESSKGDCHKFEENASTQKATQLPINIKQDMKYLQARRILLNDGWQSNKSRWQEIDDCNSTGMGYCSFNFRDAYGNKLTVVTADKSGNLTVDNWSLSQ